MGGFFMYKDLVGRALPAMGAGMPAVSYQSIRMQTKAYGNGGVDLMHHRAVYTAHMLPQTLFVQGTDLL